MRNKPEIDKIRRRFLLGGMATVACVPFLKTLIIPPAHAADLPLLQQDDTIAKALKYHHDANAAPRTSKGGTAAKDQFCHNCKFIQADEGEWRPCQIFPGIAVNKNGWCSSWISKS